MFEVNAVELPEILGPICRGSINLVGRTIRGVSTDSRTLQPGNLFIPLQGERFDGHHFIEDALKLRCTVLSSKPTEGTHPGDALIHVSDTLKALTRLAAYWRVRAEPRRVICITGSNGKTSTKQFIHQLCSPFLSTFATQGNLNNHIGVPLTLLSLPRNLDLALIEIGMNHLGEVNSLAQIARPDWGVITSIGVEHIGEIGSIEKIAQAETEFLPHLPTDGQVFAGMNHPALEPILIHDIHTLTAIHSRTQKVSARQGMTLVPYQCHQKSLDRLNLTWKQGTSLTSVWTRLFGLHFGNNVLLALQVAQALGLTLKKLTDIIHQLDAPSMRCQVIGKKWIVDCYNANPASMDSLFETLKSLKKQSVTLGKRRWCLILGDMRELGFFSEQAHRELAFKLIELNPHSVWLVGPEMRVLSEALLSSKRSPKDIRTFQSASEVKRPLEAEAKNFGLIALKASRGIELEKALPDDVNRQLATH